jgi:hypothetical protein
MSEVSLVRFGSEISFGGGENGICEKGRPKRLKER